MKLTLHNEPFPHAIIEDLYDSDEEKLIWDEIEFLSYRHKMGNAKETGSAFDDVSGTYLKQNYGIHLDELYPNRDFSNILFATKKIWDPKLLEEISSTDYSFWNYRRVNTKHTLLSYYENSNQYKPHRDSSQFTALTWFYKEPKQFEGGDMCFPEYDHNITIKNNMCIIFHSFVQHQVTKVKMEAQKRNKYGKFTGLGRYSISQFMTVNYQ